MITRVDARSLYPVKDQEKIPMDKAEIIPEKREGIGVKRTLGGS